MSAVHGIRNALQGENAFAAVLISLLEKVFITRKQGIHVQIYHRFRSLSSFLILGYISGRIAKRAGFKKQHPCLQRKCRALGSTAIFGRRYGFWKDCRCFIQFLNDELYQVGPVCPRGIDLRDIRGICYQRSGVIIGA